MADAGAGCLAMTLGRVRGHPRTRPAQTSSDEPSDPGPSVQPTPADDNVNTTGAAAPPNAGQDQNGEGRGYHSWAAEAPAGGERADGGDGRRSSTTSTSTTTVFQRQGNDRWQWQQGHDRWWSYWDNRYYYYSGWRGDNALSWRPDDRQSGTSEDNHSDGPRPEQADPPVDRTSRRRALTMDLGEYDPILRSTSRATKTTGYGGKGASEKLLISSQLPAPSGCLGEND